jgi:hypothetical protein
VGNLNGLYGYAATTYGAAFGVPSGAWLKVDPTNGIRLGHNVTTKVQIDASGNASFAGAVTAGSGAIGSWTIGASELSSGGIHLFASATPAANAIYVGAGNWGSTDTGFYANGAGWFSLKDRFTWNGTTLVVKAGNVTLDSGGITIPAGGITSASSYGFTNGGVHKGGLYGSGNDIYVGCEAAGKPSLQFSNQFNLAAFTGGYVQCLTGFTTRNAAVSLGNIDCETSYMVGGTKVVGARGAAVADASATIASVQAQLNLLLARCRAHGLIA